MLIRLGYSRISALAGAKDLGDGTLGAIPALTSLVVVQAQDQNVRCALMERRRRRPSVCV